MQLYVQLLGLLTPIVPPIYSIPTNQRKWREQVRSTARQTSNGVAGHQLTVTSLVDGAPISIGNGFSARSFRAREIGPAMDPLVMVDHYLMSEDTFGVHPHAGLSAVSLILPDSEGRYRNRDSLGNDFDLLPGDLYWLSAGSGAIHHESPREGARTHGLQVFVNVPQKFRFAEPASVLVRRQDMPELSSDGYRVRVAMGKSNGVAGARSPGLPMTIVYGEVFRDGSFDHKVKRGRNVWVHAVHGDIEIIVSGDTTLVPQGQAMAIGNSDNSDSINARVSAHHRSGSQFALFDGQAIKEKYVHQGPFVMGTVGEIEAIHKAYAAGRFGSIK